MPGSSCSAGAALQAGPCTAVTSTWRRFLLEAGASDAPVRFYSVNVDRTLGAPELAGRAGRCAPAFLFFRHGRQVGEVEGVDVPQLQRLLQAHSKPLPPPAEPEGEAQQGA